MKEYDLTDPENENSARTPRARCANFAGNDDGGPTNSSCLLELDSEDYGPCTLTEESLRHTALGFVANRPCIMFRLTRLLGFFPNVPKVNFNST